MAGASEAAYVGRFAPSPTGPLHFGSLLAAIASYLDARRAQGRWLVRIEDIDPPREMAGADRLILTALERYGFEWDGPVSYQSTQTERHHRIAADLERTGKAYRCGCSRKDLADAERGPLGSIYPGNCRAGTGALETALRIRTNDQPLSFEDRLQGNQSLKLESESGDFIVRRRDGLIAYHLAVVLDDAEQGVTDVVRGIDLLPSTPLHIYLQRLLALPTPRYAHIPVAEHPDGSKLSKLTGASPLPADDAPRVLHAALAALSQAPPERLARAPLADIWDWGISHWTPLALVGRTRIAVQHYC